MLVDVAAVGGGVGEDDFAAAVGVELAKSCGATAEAAPLAQSTTMRWPSRERPGTAARRKRMYSARSASLTGGGGSRSRGGGRGGRAVEVAEDFVFDGEFGGVGEFVAVGAEELDAVVLPGIVRGGDDDAGGEAVRAGEVSDGGRGDDAGGFDGGSAGGEAGGERGGDPVAGLAGVLADKDAGRGAEMMREREADGVDRGRIEGRLAGDAANAVRSEELLHELLVSVRFAARDLGPGGRGWSGPG